MNHQFKSAFIRYLNEEKHQSLDTLAVSISQRYAYDEKRWQQFVETPIFFEQAVNDAFTQFSSQDLQAPRRDRVSRLVDTKGMRQDNRRDAPLPFPPHKPHSRPTKIDTHQAPPYAKPDLKPNLSSDHHQKMNLSIPIALLNAKGEVVHGRFVGRRDNHFFSDVKDADGQTIAQFSLPKNTTFSSVHQKAYLSSFNRTLWIVLVMGMLVSFLAAHLLASAFTKPIARLNFGVKALKNRNFDAYLAVNSQDELGQLSQAFNEMIDKLSEYETQQRTWLGNISHDLRTPVAVLSAEINAVLDGVRKPSQATFESLLQEIDSLSLMLDHFHQVAMKSIKHGKALDNGVPMSETDASQHAQSTPLAQAINPTPLLKQLIKRSKNSVSDAKLNFKTQLHNKDVMVNISELALMQIWQNLLQNSIRYTDAGGQIRVSTTIKNNRFILTWQDSAPSVPDDALNKLTERLFRVEQSRNRAFAGSGLGLSIIKDLVNEADGELQLSHSTLGGLEVKVSLLLI